MGLTQRSRVLIWIASVVAGVVAAAPAAFGTHASAGSHQAGGIPAGANLAQGKIFFIAACGSCHTLAVAGTKGTKGPNLADEAPSYSDTVDQVTYGGDGMPGFRHQLTVRQIRNIAAYVAKATSHTGGAED